MYQVDLPAKRPHLLMRKLTRQGFAAAEIDGRWVQVYHDDPTVLERLIRDLGIDPAPPIQMLQDALWREIWREGQTGFASLRIAVNCADRAIQLAFPTSDHAFGDGRHVSTRLALQALDRCLLEAPSVETLIDVGTGNGILAIAAARLGVPEVVATELDADILREAQSNAEKNAAQRVSWILTDKVPQQRTQLIVANILAPAIAALVPEIESVGPQYLVLAGFQHLQWPDLAKRFTRYRELWRLEEFGWLAVVLQRE